MGQRVKVFSRVENFETDDFMGKSSVEQSGRGLCISGPSRNGNHLLHSLLDNHLNFLAFLVKTRLSMRCLLDLIKINPVHWIASKTRINAVNFFWSCREESITSGKDIF